MTQPSRLHGCGRFRENRCAIKFPLTRAGRGLPKDEAWSRETFEYMPYYEVPQEEEFIAFPVIQSDPRPTTQYTALGTADV
jgi:hypothetical protein